MGGKTRNITIQLVLQRWCKTSCSFLLPVFPYVKGKYVTGKSALKLVKLPSLKVICLKLTKIWLLKVAKFYRRLNGGVSQTCPHPSPHPIMHIHVQTSVNFRTFADLHFRSLRTFHFQILQGALPSAVDGFSLTTPYQKLKKPWRGFFSISLSVLPILLVGDGRGWVLIRWLVPINFSCL